MKKKKVADFIKEVEVINNLRHPNISTFFNSFLILVLYMGLCINSNQYLMITEYMPGGSLYDIIHKNDKKMILTEDKIFNICEDMALGMNYLHSRKVLHCDLKSSNVLVLIQFRLTKIGI